MVYIVLRHFNANCPFYSRKWKQIKLSGACGLSSALTCALVTVTTTVIHMSRLQALRECEYTRKTRTCTCYSIETHAMQDNGGNDEGK